MTTDAPSASSSACPALAAGSPVVFAGAAGFAGAALLYLGAALVVTWPLLRDLTTHLPLGTLDAPTVPWFNLWTLSWNAERLAHGLAGYWDAPIFYPARDTFALSEPQALTGLWFALLRSVTGAAAAYNGVLLTALVLNGLAARHLLRSSGAGPRAATWAGLLAVACSFALKELGVIQLLALYGPLLALAELRRIWRGDGGAVWTRLALWCAVTLWTCVYLALLMSPFLVAAVALTGARRKLNLRPLVHLLLALLVGLAAAAPLALVQRRALANHKRSAQTVRDGSASINAYARLKPSTLGARVDPLLRGKPTQRALFPGSALLLLAGLGLFAVRRRDPTERSWVWFCTGCCLLAAVLSFGNRWSIAGASPYEWLVQRAIPGFAQLRSPYRFAAFAQLFLFVPAGFGVDAIRNLRSGALRTVALGALALLLLEPVALPQPLHRLPVEQLTADWVLWLRGQPPGAVAMVPPEASGRMEDYEPVTLAMLQSLEHGHPLAGGYSGFFPSAAQLLSAHLRSFPALGAIGALLRAHVQYAVVDRAWLQRSVEGRALLASPPAPLHLVHTSGEKLIYRVVPLPPREEF